jgi:hypothetical protein
MPNMEPRTGVIILSLIIVATLTALFVIFQGFSFSELDFSKIN